MQPMTTNMQTLLLRSQRTVIGEILIQYPNPANNLQAGGQVLLDGVISMAVTRSEEQVSDTIDFTISNADLRYTPQTFTTNFGALQP